MLLKRYRSTEDHFRQLFSQYKKSPHTTWRDFYFEIASFEGWITELNIKDFEQLKSLIISDQIKKKTPLDHKEHFIDSWAEWNQPSELAEKLDSYENNRQGSKKHSTPNNKQNFRSDFATTQRRSKFTATSREDKQEKTARNVFSKKTNSTPERRTIQCYGCTDFLQSAGIVLAVPNGKWHFCEISQIQYSFYKVPSNNENSLVADSKENIAETSRSIQVPKTSSTINLRSDEGKHLTKEQRNQLNSLLQEFKRYFEPGGKPTPFSEHCINTGNSPPVVEPPYRMNPLKKELLKKELDTLLADGIIEECESPYASPVVLMPKRNASDHQPLKWLMRIKSPSGRLARWALQIQSFNPKIEYMPGKSNVLAGMLSRPTNLNEDVPCDVFAISADFPVRRPRDIREEQLKDEELKKIIDCILYRYSPEVETEEAQLVVPVQERERMLQEYHDVPTAGHYGAEGTYNKVACRYYFPGMLKYIAEDVKNCPDCNRHKPSNQKPKGLLRTPVYAQRFETIAIDLFEPLPETSSGKKWIFFVEDTSAKWVELFALKETTSVNYAKTLVEEVFLRYGVPHRFIGDNDSQFVSAVMQQTCNFLGIKQDLIPVYHPQSNPSERKNRDLKPRLAILVRDEHDTWMKNYQ
ncbi:Transposon Tf2-9 polyprotein like [Argiope bruennichi]|uniref:RNA-directed DNA polymerase n=1 Tax=Argiope bruennichi TaxID=94029 RepID=A0A8T0FJ87_ARGBR|nr:Transposon Tf2-9 polyprotein like [Argiope bruennichi]